MRILLATMQFGRSYTQGTERYVSTLAGAMRQRGHEVAIIAGDPLRLDRCRHPIGECVDEKLQLHAYPTRGWMAVVGVSPNKLVPFLKQWQPDIVHLNTPAHIGVGIALAARQLGIPVVVTAHDFWWTCPKGVLLRGDRTICDGTPSWSECTRCMAAEHRAGWMRGLSRAQASTPALLALYFGKAAVRGMSLADMGRWFDRRAFLSEILQAADAVICPSRTIRDLLCVGQSAWQPSNAEQSPWPLSSASPRGLKPAALFSEQQNGCPGVLAPDASRWHIIRNGVSASWFDEPRQPDGAVKLPAELTVGFAGALLPHKGPHLLLEAAHLLGWAQTRIRIAGTASDASYIDRLRRLAQGLSVEFVGNLPTAKMRDFLRGVDLLAVTSTWLENCPYVVLEAQAAGTTVVGPDHGGVAELIEQPQLRYPMGSAPGLADALEYVRTHPGFNLQPAVSTEEQMADATEAVYQQVQAVAQN